MSARELDAAGIFAPELRASYSECKRLNSLHGKTYYLATLLLPPGKRPYVHALYGFARYADEIVDDLASTLTSKEKELALSTWSAQILKDLANGESNDHVGAALVDTVQRFNIPIEHFEAFLRSMAMDISVTRYERYEDLLEYVYGSAAVIGLEMVPILGPLSDDAYPAAEKLGIAFQLANFIRDVGEDLDRGRIYLPLDELKSFNVDEEMLKERVITPEIKEALKFNIARVRQLQREAAPGINYSRLKVEPVSKLLASSTVESWMRLRKLTIKYLLSEQKPQQQEDCLLRFLLSPALLLHAARSPVDPQSNYPEN
jgi:phytoene synthase